ncbi:MAG: LysR family transcriptional regulator [Lachnospiraceae bacterium]|nr:LysR family transcriptional regulator [Lachnospiraceae bacterium]
MNTKLIEYILAIADEKNVSRAADRLYVSQSALSQSLINLENELGTPLFTRDQREMVLTPAGRYYVDAGREILRIKSRTYQTIRGLSRISYKIGISSNEGMHRFLRAVKPFRKEHPNVELFASEGDVKTLLKGLRREEYLAALIAIDLDETIDLPYEVLATEEIFLVLPSERFGNELLEIDCRDLAEENFILSTPGTTMRKITDRLFEELQITPNVVSETNNTNALTEMVRHDLGIGFLPGNLCRPTEGIIYTSTIPKRQRGQAIVYSSDSLNAFLLDLIGILKSSP